MDINLIGVPLKYGCDREGAQLGPAKLRELGIISTLENKNNQVYDMGDMFVQTYLCEDKYKWHKTMKYLNPVVEVNTNLAHLVYCSLSGKCFPLVIGGDHSLGMGSIAGASKYFKEMAVIWIDAHGDINDSETSPSGNIHGMPLAASMGIGHESIVNLYYKGIKVKPENVYIIGARDLDDGEVILANNLNLNLYTMDMLRQKGIENLIKEVIDKVKSSNVDGVHLSFDIDSLDKSLVPGTGTPVGEGFSIDEGKYILREILEEGIVTSMDFVELNPLLDIDGKTEKLCIDLLKLIGNTLSR